MTPNTQITQENVGLLPCPFCGMMPVYSPQDPESQGDAWSRLSCISDDCAAKPTVTVYDDDANFHVREVERIWNRRPALSPPADHIGDATEKVDWNVVGPKLVEFVSDFAAQARVGYGGVPVIRSKRVNVPAALFHRAVVLRDEIAAAQPQSNGE